MMGKETSAVAEKYHSAWFEGGSLFVSVGSFMCGHAWFGVGSSDPPQTDAAVCVSTCLPATHS